MQMTKAIPICLFVAVTGMLVAQAALAQPQSEDPQLGRVENLLRDAQREIEAFRKSGGKNDDSQHPVAKWVAVLWEFRDKNSGTRAAGRATSEAIHLLVHADRFAEVAQRADSLAPGDSAWEFLPGVLVEAATAQKDYSYVVGKLQSLLEQQAAEKFHAGLHYHLGRAYRGKGDNQAAERSTETALRLAPEAPWAKQAQGLLYEVTKLALGQPAPPISARARNGAQISFADFRGRAVLLIFWAST